MRQPAGAAGRASKGLYRVHQFTKDEVQAIVAALDTAGVPVIVVSANDDPATIRRCMGFGASGFIPKTLGVEPMRVAIGKVLEGGLRLYVGAASDGDNSYAAKVLAEQC